MTGNAVVGDVAVLVELKMKDGHVWSDFGNELWTDCADKLIRILDKVPWEAINSEISSCQSLNSRIVSKHTDVGSRPETWESSYEADIFSLEENQVCCSFEWKRYCSNGLFVIVEILLFVLKYSFVGSGVLCFLSSLYVNKYTNLKVLAHSVGKSPFVVYPEVMVASVRSRTALVISETYALVGRGLDSIDSSIWVAQTTNFPASIVFPIMYFWSKTTFSIGTSIPRSPLAIIIPSEPSIIWSMLCTASWFYIFEIRLTFGPCSGSLAIRYFLRLVKSERYLANEIAM